jgi:hypothetical protein
MPNTVALVETKPSRRYHVAHGLPPIFHHTALILDAGVGDVLASSNTPGAVSSAPTALLRRDRVPPGPPPTDLHPMAPSVDAGVTVIKTVPDITNAAP